MQKPRVPRSKKYIAFIRLQPCIVRGCWDATEPHHAGGIDSGRGVGIKGSDYHAVPLCRKHHTILHTKGKATFALRFMVSVRSHIKRLNEKFEESRVS